MCVAELCEMADEKELALRVLFMLSLIDNVHVRTHSFIFIDHTTNELFELLLCGRWNLLCSGSSLVTSELTPAHSESRSLPAPPVLTRRLYLVVVAVQAYPRRPRPGRTWPSASGTPRACGRTGR